MRANANDSGDWLPCPPGLLRDRGVRAVWHRRRRAAALAAGAGAVVILVGIGSWSILGRLADPEQHFGGIACSEVRANLPALISGGLAVDAAARVRAHLDQCPDCQALLRSMTKMQAAGSFPQHAEKGDCRCAACRVARYVAHEDRVGLPSPRASLAALAAVGN